MTGNVMDHLLSAEKRRKLPFNILFKAIIGFAAVGLMLMGSLLAFVEANRAVEQALLILALLLGALIGMYGAVRAARDASTER